MSKSGDQAGRRNVLTDQSGQFGVWLALGAFPLLIATSMVLDYRTTEAKSDAIKQALDVAVLAAVSNNSVGADKKTSLAKDIFNVHYKDKADLDLTVKVSDGRVEMNARGQQEASLSRAIGHKGFDINETSIAEMTRQNTICVMALATSGKEKIRFLGSTEFNSPTCSVQSNSSDPEGILSQSRHTPVAKSFCSAGGAKGDFKPNIRGECRVIDDPYEKRNVPNSGLCMPASIFESADSFSEEFLASAKFIDGNASTGHGPGMRISNHPLNTGHTHRHCHSDRLLATFSPGKPRCHNAYHEHPIHIHGIPSQPRLDGLGISNSEKRRLQGDYPSSMLKVVESSNYVGENKILYPGTYCGGLTINGANVTFTPGIYIIKDGSLTFKNGATAVAEEVSFVLKGKQTVITVESGSYVTIKAPRSGPMAGMAIYQDHDGDTTVQGGGNTSSRPAMSSSSGSQVPQTATMEPTGVNLISSGGELNVTGTLYFPTQALEVVGQGVLGAKAPATSFIAHQVTFADNSRAAVAVNHQQGGIPPMLPLSDDGARLVK